MIAVAACNGFNPGDFGKRACIADSDCPRPDQACISNACIQKSCSTSGLECGPGLFDCINGGCVAKTCTSDADCGMGYTCGASGFCQASFNVVSAVSVSNTSISVTFDAPPDPATGTNVSNYVVDGLTVTGTPTITGSTVTMTTSPQDVQTYTLTVSGVTRAFDQAPLIVDTAMFGGRASFNVVSAVAASSRTVVVTFDAPPDPTSATVFANYNIPGLTIADTPIVSGNQVTLPTTAQSPMSYTLTVSNVIRASDGEPLTNATAMFTGRNDFNVSGATALTSHKIAVKFDAVPNASQAMTLANYSVVDAGARPLALSGTPVLDTSTSTVTIQTATQSATTYTVTVSNVTRASDTNPLIVNTASFAGVAPFDVSSAMSINSHTITVTYDGPPDPLSATNPANYVVQSSSGALTLGTPTVSGNTVTIPTSPQQAALYTVTVTGVVRAGDNEPLTNNTAMFTGRTPFDVTSALATTTHSVTVTFDAAPNAAQAVVAANYTITNLSVLSASYPGTGNVVTLTTSPQSTGTYTVTVAGVVRASDMEPLTNATATFAGRTPFDVTGAAAVTTRTFTVSFDAAPEPTSATTVSNYAVSGLTLTAASLSGSTVTLTTSAPQAAQPYVVTVSNVTRQSDGEPLTINSASFDGRPPFDVSGAASTGNTSMTVTFDAAPNMTQATTLSNYAITSGSLSLSGTVTLSGNVVTITTSTQTAGASYTVTVSNVTRASDGEPLTITSATFTGKSGFNVVGASSVDTTHASVTFDAPPNAGQAQSASNYSIPGLTVMAASYTSGNTVTLTTTPQAGQTYMVTVSNVTRASDSVALSVNSATFTHTTFNVTSAIALTSHSFSVTFDATPDATSATTLAYYVVTCGVGCTPPTLTGTPVLNTTTNTVTISTTAQTGGQVYTVTVSNVTRASDGVALTNNTATFTGIAPFNVMSAASLTSASMSVTFDAAPNALQATTLANYAIKDGSNNTLAVTGTPTLSGNTVTIATGAQKAVSYTVTVSNVTRATDGEPLTGNTATFTGIAQVAPTVTSVSLQSTNPANTVFYNTGTATVVITGTSFASTNCTTAPLGVRLNDLDGLGNAVNTHATSCTVNSDTQITATFPAGIRTNGGIGWDVFVTNTVAESTAVVGDKLLVYAGILVAEIYPASAGTGGSGHQFVEFYNPTQNPIALPSVRVRNDMGTTDTALGIGVARGGHSKTLPSHGFVLLCSKDTSTSDSWNSHCDATYDETVAGLTANGSVYVSLGTNAQQQVIDKVGWGSQPKSTGCEGNCLGSTTPGDSAERKPGPPSGNSTDTDLNRNDFNGWSSTLSPDGSQDGTQP